MYMCIELLVLVYWFTFIRTLTALLIVSNTSGTVGYSIRIKYRKDLLINIKCCISIFTIRAGGTISRTEEFRGKSESVAISDD